MLKHDFIPAYTQWTWCSEDKEDVVSNIEGETDEEAANPFYEEPEGGNEQLVPDMKKISRMDMKDSWPNAST